MPDSNLTRLEYVGLGGAERSIVSNGGTGGAYLLLLDFGSNDNEERAVAKRRTALTLSIPDDYDSLLRVL
jgi:hypothetical protein